jgi:hypothetical protein
VEQERKLHALAAWCRRQIKSTTNPIVADALRKVADTSEKWAAELQQKGKDDQR